MSLRDHPLMRYRGVPSWPPDWIWTEGLEDKQPKGEVGIFRRVAQSNIQPSNRCFLFIDHEDSNYIGCLTVDDHGFCAQIVRFLQAHCYNRPIAEIGAWISPTLCKRASVWAALLSLAPDGNKLRHPK